MHIGVPKEIKPQEYRVGLTPAGVRELVQNGHKVLIETGAGNGVGLTDELYENAGAKICPDSASVFAASTLIVKVKEPQPEEYPLLRAEHLLFTYLHLAPDPKQAQGLLASGATAIAYETVTDAYGGLPLLAPMSEVAGRLSIQAAARCLEKSSGGAGVLLGGVPGVAGAKVLVIGAGVVGSNAIQMAVGLGAEVVVLDKSPARLRQIDSFYQGRVTTLYSTAETLEEHLTRAHAVIGAVLIPGGAAPKLVDKASLRTMQPGSVLVDVAIDQGGCFATSRPTTHQDPTFIEEGVVHYCVANMPGAVARTATFALTNATLPYVQALANKGQQALLEDEHFLAGVNLASGQITHAAVAKALNQDYRPAREVLGFA